VPRALPVEQIDFSPPDAFVLVRLSRSPTGQVHTTNADFSRHDIPAFRLVLADLERVFRQIEAGV
jgi:hypothetical protein